MLVTRLWALFVAVSVAHPVKVFFFDMDAAVTAEALEYGEQLVAFVFQGLVNFKEATQPTIMFNAGYLNFDWPGADMYWNGWLTEQQRVTFINISSSTLCGLMGSGDPQRRIKGVVRYEAHGEQEEWIMPIATTVAAQQQLLPVTADMLAKHACLSTLPVKMDLTKIAELSDREQAWEWAFVNLLPGASKKVAFNLNHYAPRIHTDPQSNATLANVDWAVQQKAFIMNFKTPRKSDRVNPLFSKALAGMDPLFSAYGWTDDEFGFVKMTEASGAGPDGTPNAAASGGGGAVFCSFATPGLSFWKLLALPHGLTQARPLPVFDRKMELDRTKSYVLLETNEGDTPRIVVSAFSRSWIDPRRGTLPISWAIDPQLGEEFPALFDYFSATAGANDSFISGPGGCGYVYYGLMSDAQIESFATRCGRLMKEYGPAVVDTYGEQGSNSAELLSNFSRYAKISGVEPQMYISQPMNRVPESHYSCNQSALDMWQRDGTPVVCTHDDLFYVMGNLGGRVLAERINALAAAAPKPYFITVYGGLKWTASASSANESLYNFWGDAIANLDPDIIPVGAQEMARLARIAKSGSDLNGLTSIFV